MELKSVQSWKTMKEEEERARVSLISLTQQILHTSLISLGNHIKKKQTCFYAAAVRQSFENMSWIETNIDIKVQANLTL